MSKVFYIGYADLAKQNSPNVLCRKEVQAIKTWCTNTDLN